MTILQSTVYDALEMSARKLLTNRMIEAFHPETFNSTGYPVHISDDAELWRYIDVMHETRLEQTVSHLLGGLTQQEFSLFRRAVEFMREFTISTFGRPLRCENALLRAMNIFRHIRAFNPQVVLELGPGSGYLGLLFILEGIGYVACENTQAFYLLQNRLWSAAAGDRFIELASDTRTFRDVLATDLTKSAVHIPWWKIIDLEIDTLPGAIDLVTANHCLAEMQSNSLKYYLRMAHASLGKTDGVFAFEGWGDEANHPRGHVGSEFHQVGFSLCYSDNAVTVYSARREAGGGYGTFPLPVKAAHQARNIARRLVGLLPLPYDFMVAPFDGRNKPSQQVRELKSHLANSRVVKLDQVVGFLREAYPETVNPEEKFLNIIGKNYL